MRLQFAFVQTKHNLTPWPLRSSQNTGQWQDLHTSDLSIAPFGKFISTTMLFLLSVRSSEFHSKVSERRHLRSTLPPLAMLLDQTIIPCPIVPVQFSNAPKYFPWSFSVSPVSVCQSRDSLISLSQASYSIDVLMIVDSVENLGACMPEHALEIEQCTKIFIY